MVQIIMDHGASWCFGTWLAPASETEHTVAGKIIRSTDCAVTVIMILISA